MTSQIDFRTLPANEPVLCIPRVFSNITESRIRGVFNGLNMGELDRIDIVPIANGAGDKFNRVFVHFRRWNNSENSNTARDRLINGKEIKILYDDPWFWKISAYRRQHTHKSAPTEGPRKPTIEFDFDQDKPSTKTADRSDYRQQNQTSDYRRQNQTSDYRQQDKTSDYRQQNQTSDYRQQNQTSDYRQQDKTSDYRRQNQTSGRERHQTNKHRQEEPPVRNFIEPRTPSSSPIRERPQDNDAVIPAQDEDNDAVIPAQDEDNDAANQAPINYGNALPPRRKRVGAKVSKKPAQPALSIEDKEDGEI